MIKITNPQNFVDALRKSIELHDTTLIDFLQAIANWHANAKRPSLVKGEFIKDSGYSVVLGYDSPLSFTWYEERQGEFDKETCCDGALLFYSDKWNIHT